MKVLVASSSLVARPITDWLMNSSHSVVGVLTTPDVPKGRGRELTENDFARLAHLYSLPVFKAFSADEISRAVHKSKAEIVVSASYGRIIRKRELDAPRYGWLNVHFSLLPRWRGASPVQRAIECGDTSTGVTVFRLDEGMDTGPIFATSHYELKGDERSDTLLEKLSEISVEPLSRALELIESGARPIEQQSINVTLAPKITKEEGRIDWMLPNIEIERKIRAFSPWPTAWSYIDGSRISIVSAELSSEVLKPGDISIDRNFIVGCGEGSLNVLEVKPEGKRAMTSLDWLRGARLSKDARFA
jgi:methionyl-tRNA formyltransferase